MLLLELVLFEVDVDGLLVLVDFVELVDFDAVEVLLLLVEVDFDGVLVVLLDVEGLVAVVFVDVVLFDAVLVDFEAVDVEGLLVEVVVLAAVVVVVFGLTSLLKSWSYREFTSKYERFKRMKSRRRLPVLKSMMRSGSNACPL